MTTSPRYPRFLLSFVCLILQFTSLVAAEQVAPRTATTPPSLTGQRVLVLGDSITQDGRYVSFLEYYFREAAPSIHCDLISIGLGSETVSGLSEPDHPYPRPCVLERLDRALKAVKPQVVFACYGMNDGIYHPSSPERLAAFNAGLRVLVDHVRATGAQLVLITPPIFDPLPIVAKTVPATAAKFGYGSPYAGYDDVLAEFGRAETSFNEPGVTVIDLHTPMAAALIAQRDHNPTFSFTRDGVHPGDLGHLLMARIIASGLGLTPPAEPLETELAHISADPVFSLVRERRELRTEAWLPFVGYMRGEKFKSGSIGATEKVVARLQNQIETLTTPVAAH